jgi:hypothetical protein
MGRIISPSQTFKFCVISDTALIARFDTIPVPIYTLYMKTIGGGKTSVSDTS